MGGGPNQGSGLSVRDAWEFDINNGENVALQRVGDMIHPRIFLNAVVLPTGDVVVSGGQTRARKFSDNGGVLQAEIYSPTTKEFSPLESMQFERTYHSACILLKDARVACMGGGLYVFRVNISVKLLTFLILSVARCVDWTPLSCNNHFDYEIFTPPYLLNDDLGLAVRPSIVDAPSALSIGGDLRAETNAPVASFALVRLGAVTHMVNNDLRRISLPIDSQAGTATYHMRVPDNARVALPGLYWLFAMDANGVPSEGWNIEIVS